MGTQERKARLFKAREHEILMAALALFRRDDWQAVTIDEIAAEAEIGKGTVYKHFDSKIEIYAALALELQEQVLAQVRKLDAGQPVLDYLRAVIAVAWRSHMESLERHRVFQYTRQYGFRERLGPALRERMELAEQAVIATLTEPLARGVREGLFPDKPIPLLILGARSALFGAIEIMWGGCAELPPADYLEQVTRFILAGLMHQEDAQVRSSQQSIIGAPQS